MPITAAQRTEITKITVAMFGAAPGAFLGDLVTLYQSVGNNATAFANALAATPTFKSASYFPPFLTDQEIATKMAANFGLTDTTTGAGKQAYDYFLAEIGNGTSIGMLFAAATDFLSQPTVPAEFQAAAKALENKTVVAEYYSVNDGAAVSDLGALGGLLTNVDDQTDVSTPAAIQSVINNTPASATGQTFTLTTGADSITGSDGNDVISAYIDASGTTDTFTAADVIDGKGGNDTLLITTDGNGAGALPAAVISNIETYSIREVGGTAGTYDFALVNGETAVINRVSTDAVTFDNIATGATLTIKGDGSTTTGATTFTMANASDAVTLNIEDGVNGGNITRNATGDTQIVINSKGASNTVGTIDLDTATALTGLTINAETNLTGSLAANYAAGATLTVNGSGTVNLTGANLSTNFASVNAANNTGGTWVVLGVNTTSFTGGSGNDVVGVDALVYNGNVVVDGGAGTDTIRLTDEAALTSNTNGNLQNFEILRIADDNDGNGDTFDVSLLSGITGIEIDVISANDGITLNNVTAAQAQNIQIRGNDVVGPTINVSGATTVGQIDTLGLEINDDQTATNTLTVANLTAAGVEKLNVNAVDNFTLQAMTGMGALTEANFTGSGNVSVITGALALNVNTIVDASQLTGTFTIDASAATTNGLAIKGSATKQNTITGTAQADSITGGSVNDTITGGNGIDQIDISQGGDDTLVLDGIVAATNRDVITGFTAGAYQANTGVDRIEVNDLQATTNFAANAATFQVVTSAPTAALSFTTNAANVLEIAYDMTGAANDLDNSTDGTDLLANLGQTLNVNTNQDSGYIIAYQDSKAYLYHVAEGGDAGVAVAAADVALVGVFNNVAAGAFDASNFVDLV